MFRSRIFQREWQIYDVRRQWIITAGLRAISSNLLKGFINNSMQVNNDYVGAMRRRGGGHGARAHSFTLFLFPPHSLRIARYGLHSAAIPMSTLNVPGEMSASRSTIIKTNSVSEEVVLFQDRRVYQAVRDFSIN